MCELLPVICFSVEETRLCVAALSKSEGKRRISLSCVVATTMYLNHKTRRTLILEQLAM